MALTWSVERTDGKLIAQEIFMPDTVRRVGSEIVCGSQAWVVEKIALVGLCVQYLCVQKDATP